MALARAASPQLQASFSCWWFGADVFLLGWLAAPADSWGMLFGKDSQLRSLAMPVHERRGTTAITPP